MTTSEALARYSDACSAVQVKEQYIRDGNWGPLAHALRHCKDKTEITEAGTLNGDTVVMVTPDSPLNLPPFLLVVK